MAAPKTQSRTSAAKQKDAEAQNAKGSEDNGDEAEKESAREAKAREKAEAEAKARQAMIESGDLIVDEKGNREFTANTKETRVSGQVAEIVDEYRNSDKPLVFAEVVDTIGAKYPEDLIPAMHALEHLGLVRRFDARSTEEGAGNRRSAAYLWVGDQS